MATKRTTKTKRGGSGLVASLKHIRTILARIEKGRAKNVDDLMTATGLGRAQVFNLLRQLKDAGVKIEKPRGQPYVLHDKGPFV